MAALLFSLGFHGSTEVKGAQLKNLCDSWEICISAAEPFAEIEPRHRWRTKVRRYNLKIWARGALPSKAAAERHRGHKQSA
jgi:hypothetical protein